MAQVPTQTYTVAKGDNLSAIAKKFGVGVQQISGYKSGNPNLIYPGEVLTLPKIGGTTAPPTTAPTTAPTTTPTVPKTTGGTITKATKQVGGWYDNPATGKNQRWWGSQNGQDVWTSGEDPHLPQSAEQVTPYLNDYQNGLYNGLGNQDLKGTITSLKSALTPTTTQPAALNRVEEYNKLRVEQGVAGLETTLNDLKGQEDELLATLRARKTAEEGKTVPMNVIAGRISEEQRQTQEQLDFIGRQKTRVVDELNTKYNVINQVMTLENLDYQDATARYDKEYTQNLQLYQVLYNQAADEKTAAKANLQIYANAAISGNINYDSLDSEQKLQIRKLEIQAGLPVGFIASVKSDPKKDIVFTSSSGGVTQVGMRNADGTISVQSYGTPTTATTPKPTQLQFNEDTTNIKGVATSGGWSGEFEQIVKKYAPLMSLQDIYRYYLASPWGQQYGNPKENAAEIKEAYDYYRGTPQ